MKCNNNHEMAERRGSTQIDEGGVSITLDDVRIFTCKKCGVETPAIPKMEALFREVARPVRWVSKHARSVRNDCCGSTDDLNCKCCDTGATVRTDYEQCQTTLERKPHTGPVSPCGR